MMISQVRDHGVFHSPDDSSATMTDAQLVAARVALDIEISNRAKRVEVETDHAEREKRDAEAAQARRKFSAVIEAQRNERGKFFLAFREAAVSLGRLATLGQEAATLANTINAIRVAPDPILLREAAEAATAPNPLPQLLDEFAQTDGLGWDWNLALPMPVLIPKR